MEVRPGYKMTEVGVIPEDWEIAPVEKKGDVVTGKALAIKGPGALRPYLRTKNVFDGKIDIDDVLLMPMTDAQFEQFRVLQGDVLLNEGQSLELVGRCAIYQGDYPAPCAIQNALLRFRAKPGVSGVFASYVFRFCQQSGVFARVALQTTSIAHLGGTRFQRLRLAWPKTEKEQLDIATTLSDMDLLLAALERLIAKKRDLKQAAMQQLLTGQTRLLGFADHWGETTLGELGTIYGGLTGKTKADFGRGSARYVTFMNVMTNVVIDIDTFERVRVSANELQNRALKGDLLLNGSSETPEELAMCAFLADEVPNLFLNSFCFGYRLRSYQEADGLFLAFCLRGKPGREMMKSLAQGSTRYNLSKAALLNSSFRLPRLEEQLAIVHVLTDIATEISKLEQRLAKTRALKQGMMQELLTGRIRLVHL